jgi:hypothetical protein
LKEALFDLAQASAFAIPVFPRRSAAIAFPAARTVAEEFVTVAFGFHD